MRKLFFLQAGLMAAVILPVLVGATQRAAPVVVQVLSSVWMQWLSGVRVSSQALPGLCR